MFVCVLGNISLSATRVAHKFLTVQKCGDVMNFDINENTINQSGYLRREQSGAEQHVAVFELKTGIPAKPEAHGEPKPK